MDVIPNTLASAALAARERLAAGAFAAAASDAAPGGAPHAAAMATAAREATFADALLGAMRARLEEVKNAAR